MLTSEKQSIKKNYLRYAEYYDMTDVFDKLYADSLNGKEFTNLCSIISCRDNILLAYRTIKRNGGSGTAGTDGLTIRNLEKIDADKFVSIVQSKLSYYQPKPVRRVEIPKPNGKKRPLGIPCIWDRIVQQCILQVMQPICEAKFHERSNAFRPNRSAENAMAQCYKMIQRQGLYYVVNVDIEGFFDNVNHCKLRKQIWSLGIHDKKLLSIISAMFKAPIRLLDGTKYVPTKGVPQGGILSPLLSNIVLNELDWWITSQWEDIPTKHTYGPKKGNDRGSKFAALRKTNLKEMYIVRYADDFRIFCRNLKDAQRTLVSTTKWLQERLHLNVSSEKTDIIDLRQKPMEFLGFDIKAVLKGGKYVVASHMTEKAITKAMEKLKEQICYIQHPRNHREEALAVSIYNATVMGLQNYYRIATCITIDCSRIAGYIDKVLKKKLGIRLKKTGTIQNKYISERYGMSKQVRFTNGYVICPIGYVQKKNPMYKPTKVNAYTPEGRELIHKSLGINVAVLHRMMRETIPGRTVEYMDNRISLYAAQYGKCAITEKELTIDEIHCHHIIPVHCGGNDLYNNLVIIHKELHRLIHAKTPDTISEYLTVLKPSSKELHKVNKYRLAAGLNEISLE